MNPFQLFKPKYRSYNFKLLLLFNVRYGETLACSSVEGIFKIPSIRRFLKSKIGLFDCMMLSFFILFSKLRIDALQGRWCCGQKLPILKCVERTIVHQTFCVIFRSHELFLNFIEFFSKILRNTFCLKALNH